ncbi:hypothetical protein [Nocardia beijingensis]|uniref:Uncharacterized protein n=1 Tax=Nocardia beijingensis TaxID=95162 RepID=A0ABW7WCD5_9NOCA
MPGENTCSAIFRHYGRGLREAGLAIESMHAPAGCAGFPTDRTPLETFDAVLRSSDAVSATSGYSYPTVAEVAHEMFAVGRAHHGGISALTRRTPNR